MLGNEIVLVCEHLLGRCRRDEATSSWLLNRKFLLHWWAVWRRLNTKIASGNIRYGGMNKTALLSGYKAYKIEQVIETFFFFKKLAAGSVRIDSHAASQPGGGGVVDFTGSLWSPASRWFSPALKSTLYLCSESPSNKEIGALRTRPEYGHNH